MKYSLLTALALGLFISGCSKQEETAVPAAPKEQAQTAPAAAKPATPPAAEPAKPEAKPADKPAETKPAQTNAAPPAAPAASVTNAPTEPVAAAPAQPPSPALTATNEPAPPNALQGIGQSLKETAVQTGLGMLSNRLAKARGETNSAIAAPAASAAATLSSTGGLASLASALPLDSVTQGLKEALGKGLERAVAELGKNGGFLTNLNVKIPMPPAMQQVEKTLRTLGQDKMADDFIVTMNKAAEQAVPASGSVFTNALSKLTLQDAQAILKGAPDGATQFFRKATESELREKFMPIVKEATEKVGVTAAYKQLMSKTQFAAPLLGKDTVDLDSYIATKSLDGLFKMVADEEKRIRENPAARSTELLKSVFGGLLGK